MKIGIIACKDGKAELAFPIINYETEAMETWDDVESAKDFARNNILCMHSECILIDLETGENVGFC